MKHEIDIVVFLIRLMEWINIFEKQGMATLVFSIQIKEWINILKKHEMDIWVFSIQLQESLLPNNLFGLYLPPPQPIRLILTHGIRVFELSKDIPRIIHALIVGSCVSQSTTQRWSMIHEYSMDYLWTIHELPMVIHGAPKDIPRKAIV